MNNQLQFQPKPPLTSAPTSVPAINLQRKCTACGQQPRADASGECEECNKNRLGGLQTKLAVSQPGDLYEQEADRVAAQIMRMPASRSGAARTVSPATSSIQRETAGEGAEQSGEPLVNNVISSPGQPLDVASRAFFEPRFGHDFSRVRVHADEQAAASAAAVKARAYTVGEHVVFGTKQFSPGSTEGRQLLAHELTHVIQQGGADPGSVSTESAEAGDTTVVPEEGSETGDSGLSKHEKISAGETTGDISRQVTPKLSSGLMLQRADCPCCADGITISNINRIDIPTRMGHSFDVDMNLMYPASGPQGRCILEWWEKTNVPYTTGMAPDTWTDMFALLPTSPTLAPWVNRSEVCASSSPVKITDPPSLSRNPGRTVTRTLEFRIVINSMPATSEGGCGSATQKVTAKQVLAMVNGAPDWAASSFTTP
jgi:hypothetical protein